MAAWTPADIGNQTGRTFVVTGANRASGSRRPARSPVPAPTSCSRSGTPRRARRPPRGSRAGAPGTTEVRRWTSPTWPRCAPSPTALDGPGRRADQQRGPHGDPRAAHRRRVRDAGRHELPRALRAHRPAARVLTDRVVTLSSVAHRWGRIDLSTTSTGAAAATSAGSPTGSPSSPTSCSPTSSSTASSPPARRCGPWPRTPATARPTSRAAPSRCRTSRWAWRTRSSRRARTVGAQPTLYAATMPDLPGGSFIGPSGFQEISGPPVPVGSTVASHDREVQARLWDLAVGADRRHAAHPRRRTVLSTPAGETPLRCCAGSSRTTPARAGPRRGARPAAGDRAGPRRGDACRPPPDGDIDAALWLLGDFVSGLAVTGTLDAGERITTLRLTLHVLARDVVGTLHAVGCSTIGTPWSPWAPR